ncbi:MAG: hypothetical protein H7230_00495 [Candidatus Parcubacteria bacterium]|nr:hypothetical protein [Candidatus Paceibacterota bacterium]
MVNNFRNKNKKIWYSIILFAILSVVVIGLIVYNKLGENRSVNRVNMAGDSSQSMTSSLPNSASSQSFGDKPMDIMPPALTIPK